MVFPGSVPAIVNQFADEHLKSWQATEVWVGCSGGFTVEQHLTQYQKVLHSCDVILYSDVVGSYFAGHPLDLHVQPEMEDELGWVEEYLQDPAGAVATTMLLGSIGMTLGRGEKDNAYFAKLRAEHRRQWPRMFDATLEKVRASQMKLASYSNEDVMTWLDKVPDHAAVVAYPPFAGGGAATYYASDFTGLEKLYGWEPPEYGKLDDDTLNELYAKIADRPEFMFATSQPVEFLADKLRARSKTTNRSTTIYLYASGGPKRLVTPHQQLDPIPVPHIGPGDTIGGTMKLHLLSGPQFQAARSMFMNPGIRPGSAALPMAVTVDGKLVGVFAYDFAPSFAKWDHLLPSPHVYLMSDFPVSSSDYPKLSKLIVMAALSREAEQLVLRYGKKPYKSMTTTALSKNPQSMKYRGALDLLKRSENKSMAKNWAGTIDPNDSYFSRKFELMYGAPLGRWGTLENALTEWKRRWGQKREDSK